MKKWFEEKKEWIKRHFDVFDTILFITFAGMANSSIYTFVKTLMEGHYALALFNFIIMAYSMSSIITNIVQGVIRVKEKISETVLDGIIEWIKDDC